MTVHHILASAAFAALFATTLMAQGGPPQGQGGGGRGPQPTGPAAPGKVVGVTAFAHSVADLDRAVAFYRNVYGFEIANPPAPASANADFQRHTNTQGLRNRTASLKLPRTGFVLTLVEFSGGPRPTPAKPRQTDPGQTNLLFRVRDVDAAFTKLSQAGAEMVTLGGKPVSGGNGAFASVFMRDPDGYVVEHVRAGQQPPAGAGDGNVTTTVIAMTAESTDAKLMFYRDFLGFEMVTGNWGGPQFILDMVGAGQGEFRQSNTTAGIPGTSDRLEFYEYRGLAAKTAFKPRLQDPAASMVSFLVKDVDEMVRLAKAANISIVTAGGQAIRIGSTRRIVVQDPDGVYVELIQQ